MNRASAALRPAAKILAPAVLMCLAGGAHAELPLNLSIYGFLNAEVESVQATGGATPYARRGRVADGTSRLGFSGWIPVDEHTKGVWQLEGALSSFDQGGVNNQGKSGTLTSRNSFVGLKDDRYGQVLIGNFDSVYRSLIGSGSEMGGNLGMTSHGLDVWNNTSAQLTGNVDSVFSRGESRYKNSVHYLSPVFYGVQAGASYGMDEARTDGANHDRYSVAAKYANGPFELGIGYDHQKNVGADADELTNGYGFTTDSQPGVHTTYAKIVASYKLPTHTYVGIGYERASYGYSQFTAVTSGGIYSTVAEGQMKQGSVMVSLAQDVGDKLSVMGSFGKLGRLDGAVVGTGHDYGATQLSLGAQYSFNKYLATYVFATRINNKSQQRVNLGEDPLYSNDSGSSDAYLAPGNSPRAAGLGIIARF